MNKHFTSRLTIIAAALMTVYGQAQAEDDEVRQYSKPDSSISIGVGGTQGDREQMGKYDGVTGDDTHALVDVDIRKRDDTTGTWLKFSTHNLDYENRELKAEYEQQGNWGVSLEYNQTPSRNPNAIKTGVWGVGSNTLTYGGIGTTTATAQAALNPATGDVHLSTRRDTTTLSIVKHLMPNLSFNFSFKNEDKTGSRAWGRGVNPEFAAEPINWNIRQIDGILNYADKVLQLSGGFSGSWFSNANSFVDTIGGSQLNQTASTTNSTGHTFLSLPLDNQAYQLFLDGGYNFSKTTRGTFKASYTHATQNASLSPITNALVASGARGTSTYIPFVPGAPEGLDGEVNTKLMEIGLSARPISKLSLVANLRYQDREDKTPMRAFGRYWTYRCSTTGTTTYYLGSLPTSANCASGTANTISASPTEIDNNPRDFKNLAGKLEATYQLPEGYNLTAGYNYDKRERGFEIDPTAGEYLGVVKMRGKTEEDTWRLQLSKAVSETVSGSISYLHSKRDGSTWHVAEGAADADHPINFVNPAPYADRKRNQWRVMLDWAPTDALSLQLNMEHAKDEYGAGKSGLHDGKTQLVSLDGFYNISPDWQLNGWLSHDTNESHTIGYTYDTRTTTPINWACTSAPGATISAGCTTDLIWDANLKDVGNSIGLGLKGNATAKLKLGGNVQWTRNKSEYPIASNVPTYYSGTLAVPTSLSKQGLPDITTTLTRLALYGEYALDKNSDIRVDLVHERWKSDDWTFMEWNAAGTSLVPFTYMDGTTVTANQDQSATFLGVRYIYKFQ